MRARGRDFFLAVAGMVLSGCVSLSTVSHAELMERTRSWNEPKVATRYYQGTKKGFHYFYFWDVPVAKRYRVPVSEISVDSPF